MMPRARLAAKIASAWVLTLAPALAYYHYNHYTSHGTLQEKFDLNALQNRTLTFHASDSGPTQYGPNDSFPSVLSQIRQAAAAWNAVDTSDLRVAFGGLATLGTPQTTPGAVVVFDDLPPGVLGLTGRNQGDLVIGPNGPFIQIAQSTIRLSRDLTRRPGPSYLEGFFTTVVHEMGHALGLQHTFTSSAMSTSVTRSTSRTKPIDADDVAGISLLYPSRTFAGSYGAISGRVTMNGQPVHMASVVALRPTGTAISAMTAPDGTYKIEGLPLDSSYWVYAHPIPPSADIAWPQDESGKQVAPSGYFETVFYPGTRDPNRFQQVTVSRAAGGSADNVNFTVQPRSAPALYDVEVYSYMDGKYVTPAYVNALTAAAQRPTNPVGTLAVTAPGITTPDGKPASGLGVQILGAFGGLPASYLPFSPPYLAVFVPVPPFVGSGPRHLLFTLPNDIYVLPSAVNLVQKQPPSAASVTPGSDGTVAVSGGNLNADSRVFFDGMPAPVRVPFTGNDQTGTIVVAPPQGASNQTATVTVVNADGQHSLLLNQNPPTYNYGPSDAPFAVITPNVLPAGVSSMVEVIGTNTKFADGQTILGFGSSDLYVRRVWVLSPTRLLANVVVAPNAPSFTTTQVSILTGFQIFNQAFAFQTLPANPRLPAITLPLVNASPTQTGIYPGAAVTMSGANLAATPSSAVLTLSDPAQGAQAQTVQVQSASATQISFIVPANLQPGPYILRLNNGADAAAPIVLQIDAVPPVIASVASSTFTELNAGSPAQPGDTVNLFLLGLDPAAVAAPHRIRINEDGAELIATQVVPVQGQSNMFQVQVTLSPAVSGPRVQVTVSVDGASASNPVFIHVRGA